MKKILPLTYLIFLQINQIFGFCAINWEGSPCAGNSLRFNGSLSGTTHDWIFEDATGSKFTSSGNINVNFAFLKDGASKVTYITTVNGSKCTTSLNINIKQSPKIRIKLTTLQTQCFENNSFCFSDSSYNPNGAKIKTLKYEISDGQIFENNIASNITKSQFCFSLKNQTGGTYNVKYKIIDENGCQDTTMLNGAIIVRGKIGASFSSNKPVACDSVMATIKNKSLILQKNVKTITWNWGDGTTDITWGPDITHWFRKKGVFNSQLIIQTIDGCIDTFKMQGTATVYKTTVKINSDKDSTCISNPTVKFSVDEIPSSPSGLLWNFGDPNSGPQNSNNKSWSPEHSFTGLGPFLIKLTVNNTICGTKSYFDTVTILGPSSAIESAFQRVADYETYQCPKDVMDTVHFRKNLSTFYHNDKNYTDDDSMFYKNGTRVIGHNFQWLDPSTKKNPKQIWQKPIRNSVNTSGIKSVYAGTEAPGGGFDPLKRERGTAVRLWDFGDNYAPRCTTDTRIKKNIRVNCNFTKDSTPNHYYKSWDQLMLSQFKNTPMEDALFIESTGTCKKVNVWADSIFWVVRDTYILVPNSVSDLNDQKVSKYVGNKLTTFWKEKGLRGICERYIENYVDIALNTGDSVYINGVLKKGPTTFSAKPGQTLNIKSKTDSATFWFTPFVVLDTIPNNFLKIRQSRGENPVKITSFKRKPAAPLKMGVDYFINFNRFRELYYAKIPQCNVVKLIHKETVNSLKCESEATKQLSLMHANAGGVGSGMIKDAVECLGNANPSYGVSFLLGGLKPGCTFSEIKINYDTTCGNSASNWNELSSLSPGGRPLSPPLPFWSTGYQIAGNVPNKYSHTYNANDVCGKNGCVTVGIIVGNGIAAPGGNSATRPLCSDTQYYANFACFPIIDPSFKVLNIKQNKDGNYKICKNNSVMISPSANNLSQIKDLKTIRYGISTGNAGPNFANSSNTYIQEDYHHNQIKVPGKNPNYLYNYIVITRSKDQPKQIPCSQDWEDGQLTLLKKPDTIFTCEYKKFKLAADVSKVWDNIKVKLESRGFDPYSLADTQIAKLIWNGKGIIGNSTSGAFGCIDTAGIGQNIQYYFVPDISTKTILHYRDSSLRPIDLNTYYDPFTKKVKTSNAYKFDTKWSGYHILFCSVVSKNGLCEQFAATPIIVGFSNNLRLSDSIVPKRYGNALIASTDFRYFSTDPMNYGTWDWKYQWNSDPNQNPNGYDYWRDPTRISRSAAGDTNVERFTRWDWNKSDDKSSTPFGGSPYGLTGVGTTNNPWIQLGGGGIYYHKDTGVYTLRVASADSTGCRDTSSIRIFVTEALANFKLTESYEACNNTFTMNDQSKLLDPCSWAQKSCNGEKSECDFINHWEIHWGDNTIDTFNRSTSSEIGIPYSVSHSYKSNGWYKIIYKIRTHRGDFDTMARFVNVKGVRPKFEFTNFSGNEITICRGDEISFTNKSDSASINSEWSWNFGDGEFYFGPDSTWFKKAPNNNPYTVGYFVDTVKHKFSKAGTFYVTLQQIDRVKISQTDFRTCSNIFPQENGKLTFKVIVNENDTIRATLTKNHINPGDSITFIDYSDTGFDTFKWKFIHFDKTLNKWIIDSIVTSNKTYARHFSDTGNYTVEHDAYNSSNPLVCKSKSQTLNFRVDNSKTGVTQIDNNLGISISPNPVRDIMRIKYTKEFKSVNFRIIDYSGRVVKTGVLSQQIDISSLSSGNYIIIIGDIPLKFMKTQ